mgnify:CR=1 FL=1
MVIDDAPIGNRKRLGLGAKEVSKSTNHTKQLKRQKTICIQKSENWIHFSVSSIAA